MSKIKIYELADELGIERKELLAKAQAFGNSVKSTSNVFRFIMEFLPCKR